MSKVEKKSFEKAMQNIKVKDLFNVKHDLKVALKLSTDWGLALRIKGRSPHSESDILAIETVFKNYGVKEVWD